MLVALAAYLIDLVFGELPIRHPVVFMGDFISFFERRFWRDSVFAGALLALSLIFFSLMVSYAFLWVVSLLPPFLEFCFCAVAASMFLASNMLYASVKTALFAQDKRAALSMLVSRDTAVLDDSGVNKALVETYAENLSDGVVAPLFYLLLFGLPGIVVYKAVSTLDSMVGYRTARYERFGKISARLDDAANLIPSRLTALLIAAVSLSLNSLKTAIKHGKGHESPNAGYPIAAMAGALGIKLGGDTVYRGKLKAKPYFGDGESEIADGAVTAALRIGKRADAAILCLLVLSVAFWVYSGA